MTRWTFTYEFVDDNGNVSSRLTANHTDETINEIACRFLEFLRGCGYYPPEKIDDPGEAALSDALQDRIQTALEYIDVMWPRMPINSSDYHADLSNLAAILEGNQEAVE